MGVVNLRLIVYSREFGIRLSNPKSLGYWLSSRNVDTSVYTYVSDIEMNSVLEFLARDIPVLLICIYVYITIEISWCETDKPEIETRKRWVHVSPGIRTQLDCEVAAWPEAHVSLTSSMSIA